MYLRSSIFSFSLFSVLRHAQSISFRIASQVSHTQFSPARINVSLNYCSHTFQATSPASVPPRTASSNRPTTPRCRSRLARSTRMAGTRARTRRTRCAGSCGQWARAMIAWIGWRRGMASWRACGVRRAKGSELMRDDWLMGRKGKGKVGSQKELKKLKNEKGSGVTTQEIIVLIARVHNLFFLCLVESQWDLKPKWKSLRKLRGRQMILCLRLNTILLFFFLSCFQSLSSQIIDMIDVILWISNQLSFRPKGGHIPPCQSPRITCSCWCDTIHGLMRELIIADMAWHPPVQKSNNFPLFFFSLPLHFFLFIFPSILSFSLSLLYIRQYNSNP